MSIINRIILHIPAVELIVARTKTCTIVSFESARDEWCCIDIPIEQVNATVRLPRTITIEAIPTSPKPEIEVTSTGPRVARIRDRKRIEETQVIERKVRLSFGNGFRERQVRLLVRDLICETLLERRLKLRSVAAGLRTQDAECG